MAADRTVDWVLYTRRGCHLCEQAEDWLAALGVPPQALAGHVVDVDADPALEQLHGQRVPVLEIDGTVVLEGRFAEADVARLAGRLLTPRASGHGAPARRSGPPPS
jgi:glutaredoxin